MVKIIESDLLAADVEAIGHCCNCFTTMGSGIAKAIKEKYPVVYAEDWKTVKGDKSKLGSFSLAKLSDSQNPMFCFNIYAQYNYGRDKRYLDYEALYSGFEATKEFCIKNNIRSLGLPYKIGCNLAGGNWNIVLCMIEEVFRDLNIEVLICKL